MNRWYNERVWHRTSQGLSINLNSDGLGLCKITFNSLFLDISMSELRQNGGEPDWHRFLSLMHWHGYCNIRAARRILDLVSGKPIRSGTLNTTALFAHPILLCPAVAVNSRGRIAVLRSLGKEATSESTKNNSFQHGYQQAPEVRQLTSIFRLLSFKLLLANLWHLDKLSRTDCFEVLVCGIGLPAVESLNWIFLFSYAK